MQRGGVVNPERNGHGRRRWETYRNGYSQAKVDRQLSDLGVQDVVIPRRGSPSYRGTKRRTDSEGPISYLERTYGWDRARIEITGGALHAGRQISR